MLRIFLARLGYDTAVERSFAVARIGFDRIKIENRFTRIGSLDAPQQFHIARQQRLHLRQVQVTVHRSGIERQCTAHYRTCTELPLLVNDRLQFCKKRVLCTHRRSVMHLCGGFVLGCEAVQFFEQRRFLFGLCFGYSGIGGQNGLRCRFGNAIRCTRPGCRQPAGRGSAHWPVRGRDKSRCFRKWPRIRGWPFPAATCGHAPAP